MLRRIDPLPSPGRSDMAPVTFGPLRGDRHGITTDGMVPIRSILPGPNIPGTGSG
ncbi:hypothetical protein [Azospirillum endophyticum]